MSTFRNSAPYRNGLSGYRSRLSGYSISLHPRRNVQMNSAARAKKRTTATTAPKFTVA